MKYQPQNWKTDFDDDGFIIVEDLIDPPKLLALRDGMDEIAGNFKHLPAQLQEKIFLEREHVKNSPEWYRGKLTPEECGVSVRQIDDLALFDQMFAQLICYPPLLDVLEVLFESPEFSFNFMVGRPKAAQIGNGVRNGAFHRDSPEQAYTSPNVFQAFLCLDEMTKENGPTMFIRGSHKVSDDEAGKRCWMTVEPEKLNLEDQVSADCPAGSGLFFSSKILHAAGHNRSGHSRRTINLEWTGPEVLTTSPERFAYQGLRPRSKEPVFEKQLRMTFRELFARAHG
ncbi:MAG TPA: phytanoyl-CoA dioxygenase family protein [Pyrinomonadaceae bacterium]|nr:phytanoyl-CoA dioxygenase family protein [Pyrinomonadaceae bacterium]